MHVRTYDHEHVVKLSHDRASQSALRQSDLHSIYILSFLNLYLYLYSNIKFCFTRRVWQWGFVLRRIVLVQHEYCTGHGFAAVHALRSDRKTYSGHITCMGATSACTRSVAVAACSVCAQFAQLCAYVQCVVCLCCHHQCCDWCVNIHIKRCERVQLSLSDFFSAACSLGVYL